MFNNGVHGVAYPSVQTDFAGQNIVLPLPTIDQFLILEVVATQLLHKHLKKSFFNNHHQVAHPLASPDNLQWEDLPQNDIANIQEIRQFLLWP